MIYMLFGQCDHSRLWMDGIGLCIGNPCVDPQFHQCWVHPWILYHFPACHSRPHLCSPQPVPISLRVSVLELWLFCSHKELGQPLTSDGRVRDSSGLPRLRQSEALTCCYSGRIQIKQARGTGSGGPRCGLQLSSPMGLYWQSLALLLLMKASLTELY